MIKLLFLLLLAPAVVLAEGSNATPPVNDVANPEDLERGIRRFSENVLPSSGGDTLFYRDVKNQRIGIGTTTPTVSLEVFGDIRSSSTITAPAATITTLTVSSATVSTALIVSSAIGSGTPAVDRLYNDLWPKAYGQIDAGGSISFGVNITSASRPSAGNYQVNFLRDFSSVSYICMAIRSGGGTAGEMTIHTSSANWTAHTAIFRSFDSGGAASNNNFSFACFGDQ